MEEQVWSKKVSKNPSLSKKKNAPRSGTKLLRLCQKSFSWTGDDQPQPSRFTSNHNAQSITSRIPLFVLIVHYSLLHEWVR